MRTCYIDKNFSSKTLAVIAQANAIIDEFSAQGFTLTLRQLYYQFVGKALIENTLRSYKRLGSILTDARYAGLVDWDAIEDRTRNLRKRSHWDDPAGVIKSAAASYGVDLWEGQDRRVEVWIEKDALLGVIEGICTKWDVPFFAGRGYPSASEMHVAALRHGAHGDNVVILHLGDHDPSGLDMTRDIRERLEEFDANTEVRRLALNRDQVRTHRLPPNPAKEADSRFQAYEAEHGPHSWELDALSPTALVQIVTDGIEGIVDLDLFRERKAEQERGRDLLNRASSSWTKIAKRLERA
jgi:hypothetical protein